MKVKVDRDNKVPLIIDTVLIFDIQMHFLLRSAITGCSANSTDHLLLEIC